MAWVLACSLAGPSIADEVPRSYDRVNFQVSAVEEIANDTLVAILYGERSGQRPAAIAAEVNRDIGWAVDLAKTRAGIKVQTLDYRQDPLYNNQNISGWRVRQSIRLESRDVESLSALIGELQARLSVASMRYTVSPARFEEAEYRLISEALARFGNRADQVAAELGRGGYRIVSLDLITPGQPPGPAGMHAAVMMESRAMAAPSVEPGVQTVSVQVSGTIELQTPR